MSVARTKRRPATARTLSLGLAAAIGVHVIVVGTVWALHDPVALAILPPSQLDPATGEARPAAELESTCHGDAMLAAAARSTACLAPWAGAAGTCLGAMRERLAVELARCTAAANPVPLDVINITPEEIARIDPEPLLEILAAAEQMKFEQQQQEQIAALEKQEQQRQQELTKQQAQVVETARPDTEITPENARFLSEYDTRVEKQTVARGSRDEPIVAKSKPEQLEAKPNPREASVAEPPPDRQPGKNPEAPDLPGKLSMRSPGAIAPAPTTQEAKVRGHYDGWHTPIADGLTARRGDGAIDRSRQEMDDTHGGGGAGGGAPPVPDLKPSTDVLERALGGGSVDHVEEIDEGDETALNSRRWIYASFFNRLKRQVAQNWEPGEVWRRHDPSGTVYGFKSRVTQIRVSLDAKGKLSKTPTVVNPSGVDVLDDEAVRAFEAAAPFPNPPDGLVQGDGMITFEFSFHFEIGAPRTSWRILRQM